MGLGIFLHDSVETIQYMTRLSELAMRLVVAGRWDSHNQAVTSFTSCRILPLKYDR